mgnify:CR=1 FL=1
MEDVGVSWRGSEELGKNGGLLRITGKVSRDHTPTLRDPFLYDTS